MAASVGVTEVSNSSATLHANRFLELTCSARYVWASVGSVLPSVTPVLFLLRRFPSVPCRDHGASMVAVGDNYGRVCLFRHPAYLPGLEPLELGGHSISVANLAFSK